MTESPVLIVGAGPVGLTLAIDLAWRGVDHVDRSRHGYRYLDLAGPQRDLRATMLRLHRSRRAETWLTQTIPAAAAAWDHSARAQATGPFGTHGGLCRM